MNYITPLTKDRLKDISKKFYKIDYMYFCYVDGNYIGWDYSTLSLFLSKDKGFHFIDASPGNYLLKNFNMGTIEFVRKILK